MSISISQLQTKLVGKLHGTNLNDLPSFYDLCVEAVGELRSEVDFRSSKRVAPLENALYGYVYDYMLPVDFDANKLIDMRPQGGSRDYGDSNSLKFGADFDINKSTNTLNIIDRNGYRFIRASKYTGYSLATFNPLNSTTSGGTVVATGGATGLAAQGWMYAIDSRALAFNLDASGTATITINNTQIADFTNQLGYGSFFLWVDWPSDTGLTSIELRWGSDASNYYKATATNTSINNGFKKGLNLVRFDWSLATKVLTPVITAMDYAQIIFTYVGAQSGVVINGLQLGFGRPYEMEYYSKYWFTTAAGVYIEQPTTITDRLILDNDEVVIFVNKMALISAQSVQGADSGTDQATFEGRLYGTGKREGLIPAYRDANPSEAVYPQLDYYNLGNQDYYGGNYQHDYQEWNGLN